jgi:hypothetical protein
MQCSLCHRPLTLMNAWKGTADRYYCSEFCAESETFIPVHSPKDQVDRNYLARLERLVRLRRSSSR